MKINSTILLCLFILLFGGSTCDKNEPETGQTDVENNKTGHPRIMLLEGEEAQIKELIAGDATWKKMHDVIIGECNVIITKPELERVMTGRRLLGTSRELLQRVFFLSYGYRMTANKRYLEKAEKEMLAVSRFTDWNPSHFLDVAEMTMGVAIGYDWFLVDSLRVPGKRSNRRLYKRVESLKIVNTTGGSKPKTMEPGLQCRNDLWCIGCAGRLSIIGQ